MLLFRPLVFALLLIGTNALAQGQLYRYTNDEGVRVINSTIPSKYTAKGYEILNKYGQLIEVVPPAPTEAELASRQKRAMQIERYHIMKRRYPTINDIKDAKLRRIKNIDTNISILEGNLKGLTDNHRKLMSDAAQSEREKGTVPNHLLEDIDIAQEEINVTKKTLEKRKKERVSEAFKFDEDIEAYRIGKEIEQEQFNSAPR